MKIDVVYLHVMEFGENENGGHDVDTVAPSNQVQTVKKCSKCIRGTASVEVNPADFLHGETLARRRHKVRVVSPLFLTRETTAPARRLGGVRISEYGYESTWTIIRLSPKPRHESSLLGEVRQGG